MIAAKDVVDMPDRRASLLVRLVIQNQGCLSKSKRSQFTEISDTELAAIEAAIQRVVDRPREAGTGMELQCFLTQIGKLL